MMWTIGDTYVALVGAMSAAACALLGNYLVLRKMSLMGDAISHAVLPGIVMAFLMTGSRGIGAIVVGAVIVGILTALFTQAITRFGKVEEGAAMGVVFTILFAIGLILIRQQADHVDLDPQCVLFGNIENIHVIAASGDIPQPAINLAVVLLLDALFVTLLYKQLKISALDPALATSIGINADVMHYALMVMVALTAVASFEAVGSILVIAMLIVPAVTAHLLTDRLPVMIALSVVLAGVAAFLARAYNVVAPELLGPGLQADTSAIMAVIAGGFLLLTIVFAPERGLISRGIHRIRLIVRILQEDILGRLYRQAEAGTAASAAPLAKGDLRIAGGSIFQRWALFRLRSRQFVRPVKSESGRSVVVLTDKGLARAARLVRSHRLWESYLAQHSDLPLDHLHMPAERVEHFISPEMGERIQEGLSEADLDPHGREIPPRPGDARRP
ncbi:MAG: metal ABC transporter permease [Phycisphaerales bacterium]|nr:metal ABC transporter permease [Phycisphaerales bacterium]MCB9855410.1 metal ABC transporter permease [Phycisphaerales bacterium]